MRLKKLSSLVAWVVSIVMIDIRSDNTRLHNFPVERKIKKNLLRIHVLHNAFACIKVNVM